MQLFKLDEVIARILESDSVKKRNFAEVFPLKSSFSERVGQWLASKSPRASKFTLSQRNIYIFPTPAGFAFLGLLLLMLLTAINYQNSLIYLFTFFLSSVFFISIWLCFLNLSGLVVSSPEVGRCFSGEQSPYIIYFVAQATLPNGLRAGTSKLNLKNVTLNSLGLTSFTLNLASSKRGVHKLSRLRLESRFPFGFIMAWTWLKLDSKVMVYPKPVFAEKNGGSDASTSKLANRRRQGDITDFKEYQPSDPGSRILWKKYASKEELIIRHSELTAHDPDWVKWTDYDTANLEDRLSHLCFDVCSHIKKNHAFGFDIPGTFLPPGTGEAHHKKCLEALALHK